MVNCKFADPAIQREDRVIVNPKTGESRRAGGVAKCLKLSTAAGFACSVSLAVCAACDGKIPMGGDGEGPDCLASRTLAPIYRQSLRSRLIAGELPLYQSANPVDLAEAFGKFRAVSTDAERRDLVREMFRRQAGTAESSGGLPAAALAAKFSDLAERYGLQETWNELLAEYANA